MLEVYTQTTPHLITKMGTSKPWAVMMWFNAYSKSQLLFSFSFFGHCLGSNSILPGHVVNILIKPDKYQDMCSKLVT